MTSKLKMVKLISCFINKESFKAKMKLSQTSILSSNSYKSNVVHFMIVTIMIILSKTLLIIWLLRILNLKQSSNHYKKKLLKNWKRWKLNMKVKFKSYLHPNNNHLINHFLHHNPPLRLLDPLSTSSWWILNVLLMITRNNSWYSYWEIRDLSQLFCSEGLNMVGWAKTFTLAVTKRVLPSPYLRSKMGTA